MSASLEDCRAYRDLLAGHALKLLTPPEAAAVVPHLAVCAACRDEYDCLAAVAGHLATLREALTDDGSERRPRHRPERRCRRDGSARKSLAGSLTLSQWVDRMAYVR
ncbi:MULTISPECIES: zf-HC2 domain-containing protein [Streptomyces]|uniref:zf-HC2 domain-containing protein n=1 Tax=Streptomyces TaxID=1883 RepID=UPI0029AA4C1B|nr:zf-HC2 domain-containing protein [Streptomyces sp. WI03-4A]MDX2591118.1 zf-HC2 domain-containing protein [Streptomyces sp. WI03-4A]